MHICNNFNVLIIKIFILIIKTLFIIILIIIMFIISLKVGFGTGLLHHPSLHLSRVADIAIIVVLIITTLDTIVVIFFIFSAVFIPVHCCGCCGFGIELSWHPNIRTDQLLCHSHIVTLSVFLLTDRPRDFFGVSIKECGNVYQGINQAAGGGGSTTL